MSKVGRRAKAGGAYSDKILVRGAEKCGDVWAIWRLVFVVRDLEVVPKINNLGVYW